MLPIELLVRVIQEISKTQAINVALGYLPGVAINFLLLKTPCSSNSGPGNPLQF